MSWTRLEAVAHILAARHYLGPSRRGIAWRDRFGVIVVASPTSRRLPQGWLELARWCITSDEKNAGSRQWGRFVRAIRLLRPDCTTIVSYSDPSVGHTGALYRACNWRWAPTWHRLRPPPTGNGAWKAGRGQSVKDRWVFPLRPDPERADALAVKDNSILRLIPDALYREPAGVPFKLARAA
jgi:hypothetical protein